MSILIYFIVTQNVTMSYPLPTDVMPVIRPLNKNFAEIDTTIKIHNARIIVKPNNQM